ncbi:MAG: allophanate hydrolase [Verrucomicrobia bacterium]|nr:allophanate hydrolase [Verrucomicrobiota bacterium]
MKDLSDLSLNIGSLQAHYRSGTLAPTDVIREVYRRIRALQGNPIWINLVPEEESLVAAEALTDAAMAPLFGIPFAIKDNLDAARLPTTAGCPAFSYVAERDATVVRRLKSAGGILIGKTNLDQFATGLVGVRSPYGACSSVFHSEYISGGSSSGSAVAVAAGLLSFALGTDTAGSGRVPAAFNNIVGLKPTRGILSTEGLVRACRSLDCISLFCLTAEDAETVYSVAASYDQADCYSRHLPSAEHLPSTYRIGIPAAHALGLLDQGYRTLFTEAEQRLSSLGHTLIEVDVTPLLKTAQLLYGGPWVAERFAAVGQFVKEHREQVHPVVRDIILGGETYSAVDAFNALYALEEFRQQASIIWNAVDILLLPTVPDIYRIEEIENDPVALNSRLGTFTNFVNLLDLAAIAIPAGFRADGLPFGVTFIGQTFSDRLLIALSKSYLGSLQPSLGGTGQPYPQVPSADRPPNSDRMMIAVVGAHLSGEPLNHQLTDRDARFIRRAKTAPSYQLFALPGTSPPKPGLVRVGAEVGRSIDLEVWELPVAEFGNLVKEVPSPLTIGMLHLSDGRVVKGFLCEEVAVQDAVNISEFGGWKAYLKSLNLAASVR